MQDLFLNRESSWLEFNARVLHEAVDARTPLLERVRFLGIFTSNLDEYFMKRVGGLKRGEAFGVSLENSPTHLGAGSLTEGSVFLTPTETLALIREQLLPLLQLQARTWKEEVVPQLEREGITLLAWEETTEEEKRYLDDHFMKNLFPVLTPLAVDPGHPFPFISNLSTSLGVVLRAPDQEGQFHGKTDREELFARLKIPSSFPGWIRLPSAAVSGGGASLSSHPREDRMIASIDVIRQFLPRLFPGMEILASMQFRITRNADIERDEEDAEDLLQMISEELRERRFARVVRLEYSSALDSRQTPESRERLQRLKEFLKHELELSDSDVFEQETEVDFSSLSPIVNLDRPKLKYPKWTPVTPEALLDEESSIFGVIRERDLLVHHPFESFHHTVERFLLTAAQDPHVQAIKLVLYRTGAESPLIPILIRAAEAGKQVVVLVELKARFDEERNIQAARSLEKAGVHVVYGIVGLKTHCKVALVVREESAGVRTYAHIGTGNYHATTAKLYTDFGLFTADPEVTFDLTQLFHYLTGRSMNREYRRLLVAPLQMRARFTDKIRAEAAFAKQGRPARIIAKMNSLEDDEMIGELYEASQAGVSIDLIVRGVCTLRPGVQGLSENIRVTSIIGRYLEHSRLYYFQAGEEEPVKGEFYLGSADWMWRNLSSRVEVIAPVGEFQIRKWLWDYLGSLLSDQRQVWDLNSDGKYEQRHAQSGAEGKGMSGFGGDEGIHEKLMRLYASSHAY